MPNFELMPLAEATGKAATTGKRAEINSEYLSYINQVRGGQAGSLQVTQGESIATVRRRLGVAAKASGIDLAIRRIGDIIYFWSRSGEPIRRRGRKRKT